MLLCKQEIALPGSEVYQLVQGHLETWLASCRNRDEEGSPIDAYIEQDFRSISSAGFFPFRPKMRVRSTL